MRSDVVVERDLLRHVAPAPPALPVARLIDDDPVDPGAELGLAAKTAERAEDQKEDVLRDVERLFAVAEQVIGQLEHHPLVLVHQLGAGSFVAAGAPRNQRGFLPPKTLPGC